jgi:hypothetical protein
MTDSKEPEWLTNYYQRIQSDATLAFGRRDNITNWSYTLLIAGIAAYVGLFGTGTFVIPLGRFGLASGILLVLIRFFFQSMIAYGYFNRARYLRTKIEKYWMDNTPTLDQIKQEIKNYDHGKAIPSTHRELFKGQVRSGFVLILAIPTILIVIEFYLGYSWEYLAIVIGLIIYLLLEIKSFVKYPQMKSLSEK